MHSQARIESSRANGARSHGPKTPEGRACCRAARLKHGFASSQIVLENESEDEFRALRDTYLAEFQPQNSIERGLIDELVTARWHLERLWSLQTSLLNEETARQPSGDVETASLSPSASFATSPGRSTSSTATRLASFTPPTAP